MIASPIVGFVFGALFMFLLLIAVHRFTPHFVHSLFGKLQIFSAAWMAHSHGTNDAQKTMGIITLALFTGTKPGSFDSWPRWLDFLKTLAFVLPTWVIALCAVTMAAGTAAGGWRIIRTLGHRVVKLQPLHGFAAETDCRADNSSCELPRYSTLNVQDGCGRREERENGGKNSQAEACVHMCIPIAAASKVGLKELASDAILR